MAVVPKLLFTIFALLSFGDALKILCVFPLPGKSHSILGEGYVRHLLEAGHQVTYITPFPQKKDIHPNLTEIDVSSNVHTFPKEIINIKGIMDKENDPADMSIFNAILNMNLKTYEDENMQKFLNDQTQKFDIVIVEWMFTEISCGLSVVFNCPYIWFSTVEPHWLVLRLTDESLNPAYNSDIMSGNKPPFTFFQRLKELWFQIFFTVYSQIYQIPNESNTFKNIFGPVVAKRGRTLPSYDEVRYNASLILGNSHVSLGEATRLPQNYKPIGGYHINTKVKPLPEDLKEIIENAKHGVIYFSMGSNLNSKDMPIELKKSLLKLFGALKYTVLWKFEEAMLDLPKNVHILQWAPQQSILSHPNVVLFITHGGLLSTTESVHFGMPVIGIPVFADQFINVERAVHKGFAKKVDLTYKMADDLREAIEEMLSNPSYAQKAKELSMIYHDRPASPGAELVHWVEHVVRTRGAPHLRSPALHVPWYQKAYLDLAALIVAVILIAKYAINCLLFNKKLRVKKKSD